MRDAYPQDQAITPLSLLTVARPRQVGFQSSFRSVAKMLFLLLRFEPAPLCSAAAPLIFPFGLFFFPPRLFACSFSEI